MVDLFALAVFALAGAFEREGVILAAVLAAPFVLGGMLAWWVIAIGILLAGLLMALTYIGGELAQLQMNLPLAAIQIFQGMLLFFLLAIDVLTNFSFRFGRRAVA